jgi:hypothetical protein
MRFEFDGQIFCITFSYDPNRDFRAHRGHAIGFANGGQTALWCNQCELQLTHPNSKRKRLAYCVLWRERQDAVHHTPAKGSDHAAWEAAWGARWQVVLAGRGRVNLDAKDVFTRRGGREAALADALGGTDTAEEFRQAGLAAYAGRPCQPRKERAAKTRRAEP